VTKKYERIAGTEESMILKEALEKLSEGSLSSALEGKMDSLLEELKLARSQKEEEIGQLKELVVATKGVTGESVDIEATINRVASMHQPLNIDKLVERVQEKPSYNFKIKRDSSGLLIGIEATAQ